MLWTGSIPYRVIVRWNDLFSDLEGQFASRESAQFRAGVEELAAAERASVELAARLTAARSQSVTVKLEMGSAVTGTVMDATPSWVLLREGPRDHLVPLSSIVGVTDLPDRSLPIGRIERKLTLGHALRALQGEGVKVMVEARGTRFRGVIAAVGADHVDVLEDPGRGRVTVPFWTLTKVTSV